MQNNRLVEFHDAALGYGRRVVVDHVNLTIERGDFLGIAGPNGSGKTTLLKALLRMLKPIRGSVYFWRGTLPEEKTIRVRPPEGVS